MSTTVTYKGETLTTVTNETRTLTTQGKYLEDNITLVDITSGGSGSGAVWQDTQGYVHLSDEGDIELQTKTVTPSETAQTVAPDAGYYALDRVNVGAISSSYVGSGVTRRSSSDLTASGATVTVPAGYYASSASKSVATGTAGTPTATKGTVSNHSISVTPSVTNTTGYITGGTKTGTAVSVSASELVSGTYSVTSSGTKDVTNYASISVSEGIVGFPTVTKSAVSNHSVSVTSSVNITSDGYVEEGSIGGYSVTVSASELVSGTKSITENGTDIDVTDYASVNVNVSGGGGTNWTLIGSTELTLNITSTTNTQYGTVNLSNNDYGAEDIIWVHIRDKAGKRNGYFYGSDGIYISWSLANGNTGVKYPASYNNITVSSTGSYSGTTNMYGVYGYQLGYTADNHTVTIYGCYNASYTGTIDGTFKCEVYKLTTPNGMIMFE